MTNNELKLDGDIDLRSDFSDSSFEDWKIFVEKELKGVPFEKKLIYKTYEGINLKPIYTKEDIIDLHYVKNLPGGDNYLRGTKTCGYTKNSWEISQEIPVADSDEFNLALKYDLSRGQNSIVFTLDKATLLGLDADYAKVVEVGNGGLSLSEVNSFSRALKDVDLCSFPFHMNCGFSALQLIMLFNAYLINEKYNKNRISGSVYADPLSWWIINGDLPIELNLAFDRLGIVTNWARENIPNIKTIGANGIPYHNAGANTIQELAFTLASAVEYVNQLLIRGYNIDDVCSRIRFSFGIGTFYFMEVAKLRAAKMLWSKIVESYGGNKESQKMYIHVRTSKFNQTVFDPFVNTLRTTTETFSAIIGGVDSITTNTFDEPFGNPNEFSRRLARNTQLILKEESHLDSLIDPAGGSYYIEKLTDEVAQASWKLFQNVQSMGGIVDALMKGFPQKEVEKTLIEKKSDVSKRKSIVVGTNSYANILEQKLEFGLAKLEKIFKERSEYLQKYRTSGCQEKNHLVLEKLEKLIDSSDSEIINLGTEAVQLGATLGELAKATRAKTSSSTNITPIYEIRISEQFEELRDQSLYFEKKIGSKPKVFLVTMGALSQYKTRADFAKGFFEVGGFEIIYPSGFGTIKEAVNSALLSNVKVVVICSTDETYPELVPEIVKGIKEKDPSILTLLAGYPKEQVESYKQIGIDDFIFLGADVVKILSSVMQKIGVKNA
jgi:methylmalonyl-CoA mutase